MRNLLAWPALLGLLCAYASAPFADSNIRYDPASAWTTQEWPQDGQDSPSTRQFTAPFTVGRFEYLPGKTDYPFSWSSGTETVPLGEVTTDYLSDLNVAPHGPYGLSVYYHEGVDMRGRFRRRLNVCRSRDGMQIMDIFKPCRPVGVPALIGYGYVLNVITLDGCGNLWRDIVGLEIKMTPQNPPPPKFDYIQLFNYSWPLTWMESGKGSVSFGPKVSENHVYFSVDLRSEKKAGLIRSVNWTTMTERWKSPLQSGSGLDKPIPRGQPAPPSEEVYQATTPVAIRGMLAVVGAVKMRKDKDFKEETDPNEAALFAFNTVDGSQKWAYKITKTGKIMPTPAMLEDCIVFGTSRGRVFAVGNDGKERWKTSEEGRIRTVPKPYTAPSILEDVTLHGPAVDTARKYAYFGASDGRVHRVGVRSGTIVASEPLAYYKDPDDDQAVRTFTINSSPSIAEASTGNFLCVVMSTRDLDATRDNASALIVMSIPGMTRINKDITRYGAGGALYLDPAKACIASEVGANTYYYSGCVIGGVMEPKPDYSLNLTYMDTRNTIGSNDTFWYNYPGGVSISNGYVFAIDPTGSNIALRSIISIVPPLTTLAPPMHGPYVPPFALDPVQVYPNPFRPDKAFGGTAKFRNLPRGSRVELYTLAYERVRLLTESGFRADWDGKNESGQEVASGIYHYVITIPDQPAIRGKLAVIRK